MGSIDIECAWCGESLETETNSAYYPTVNIVPCTTCLKAARDEGYDQGWEAAKDYKHEM